MIHQAVLILNNYYKVKINLRMIFLQMKNLKKKNMCLDLLFKNLEKWSKNICLQKVLKKLKKWTEKMHKFLYI